MEVSYSKKWSLFTFFLGSFILFFYVKEGVFSLNDWMYYNHSDSLKNYFNVLQAAKNGEGFWLNTVNYPYGEQLFFLDAQPLLAKIIRFFGLESYTIAIVNFLPLISISLTIIPIFLIQRILRIPLVFNVITAVIIAFLVPQISRVPMHFALAYGVFIPSLIYLLIEKFNLETFRYILIIIWIVIFSFLHPYYLLIAIIILVPFLFYHVFFQFDFEALCLNILAIILPLFIFKMTLVFTDSVVDRPAFVTELWRYKSTFSSVFAPKFKPIVEILPWPGHLPKGTFEGNAYVGILGFPILIIGVFGFLKKLIYKENIMNYFNNSKFFFLFFISFVVWLFALYDPFSFLIVLVSDMLPALKQFRSLGRFGWIFYFTFSIFISLSLVRFYSWCKLKTSFFLASLIFLVLSSLWFLDANGNLNVIKESMNTRHENTFCQSEYLSKYEIDALIKMDSVNVILSLPIFSVGSEIGYYKGSGYSIYETFILSNLMNIPYVSTYSSRVSASQFYSIKELKEKGNLEKFFTKKEKVLIIADVHNLTLIEEKILKESQLLYKKGNMVYAIYRMKH